MPPPIPVAERLDRDSVNNHQCLMRSAILIVALVLLEGCYTYKLLEFFRPDGPGTTVRDFDRDRIRRPGWCWVHESVCLGSRVSGRWL